MSSSMQSNVKILIVDDNYEKVQQVADSIKNIENVELDYVNNVRDGLIKLKNTHFDLLLVDIVLPQSLGEEPKSSSGIDMLEAVYSNNLLNHPHDIVVVTSHEQAYQENKQKVKRFGLPLVKIQPDDSCFTILINNKVKYRKHFGTKSTTTSESLEVPEKVTLNWLLKNVSIKLWGAAVSVLIVVFFAGVQSSKLSIVQETLLIDSKAPKNVSADVKPESKKAEVN